MLGNCLHPTCPLLLPISHSEGACETYSCCSLPFGHLFQPASAPLLLLLKQSWTADMGKTSKMPKKLLMAVGYSSSPYSCCAETWASPSSQAAAPGGRTAWGHGIHSPVCAAQPVLLGSVAGQDHRHWLKVNSLASAHAAAWVSNMPVQLCSDLLHISLPFQAGQEERQQLIETGTQQIFFPL